MPEVISPPIITARVRAHSHWRPVWVHVTYRDMICNNCSRVEIHEIVVGDNVVFIVATMAGETSNDSSYKNPAKRYWFVINAILNNLIKSSVTCHFFSWLSISTCYYHKDKDLTHLFWHDQTQAPPFREIKILTLQMHQSQKPGDCLCVH